MYRAAIIDDDVQFSETIRTYLERYAKENEKQISVVIYSNGVDFISNYKPQYDMILMDIEMPGLNGLETAAELRGIDKDVVLIFITQIAQYAINGYSVSAMDFLVKPVNYTRFSFSLRRALERIDSNGKGKIYLESQDKRINVKIAEIAYIEVDKHYLIYHVGGEEFRVRGTLSEAEKELAGSGFACCYNGCLVNLRFVYSFDASSVELKLKSGTIQLPISRYRKKAFLDILTEYLQ